MLNTKLIKIRTIIRKICEECGGKIVKKQIEFSMYGVKLGSFPAEVCTKCGEEVFDEKTSLEIESIAKKKGLFGLARKVKIV
ncbi:YgiT-type zinc finger protein, partial [Candidatus Woesearchaeota archaeon]|nr:YgiT-type zinc finger protein [Candidatus Woesearchaeota archaeon]